MTNALDELRGLLDAGTPGPWWSDDDENCWRLFAGGPDTHGLQLIKAPKHSTPFAEYWPSEADAALIVFLRNHAEDLLAVARAAERILRPGRGEASWLHTVEFIDLRNALARLSPPSEEGS